MDSLTVVICPNAPDQTNRFMICPNNVYGNLSDASFVPLGKAIQKDKQGKLRSRNSLDLNKRMVDDVRARVAAGAPEQWLAGSYVGEYLPSRHEFKIVYNGIEETKAVAEPEVPSVMQAQDGTFRVVPTVGFSKGVRQWSLSIAHVDRGSNVAYADRFNGITKLEVVQKLFGSPIPWIIDLVKTFKLADPSQIPQPVEPVVEKPLTAAELKRSRRLTTKNLRRRSRPPNIKNAMSWISGSAWLATRCLRFKQPLKRKCASNKRRRRLKNLWMPKNGNISEKTQTRVSRLAASDE